MANDGPIQTEDAGLTRTKAPKTPVERIVVALERIAEALENPPTKPCLVCDGEPAKMPCYACDSKGFHSVGVVFKPKEEPE